jgi:hypothetical protein
LALNLEHRMYRLAIALSLGLTILSGASISPVLAQGQGGYARDCAGRETARVSSEERARLRALHQTNDTSGGRSSIDKSCKTWESGNTKEGPQPGSIGYGFGGAHTNGWFDNRKRS